MLDLIDSLNHLNPLNCIKNKWENKKPLHLICEVALTAISLCVQAVLFYAFPNLASIGFLTGIALSEETRKIIINVNTIFESCRTCLEKALLYSCGGLMAIYFMPTTIIAMTFYKSAEWGSYFQQSCARRLERYKNQQAV